MNDYKCSLSNPILILFCLFLFISPKLSFEDETVWGGQLEEHTQARTVSVDLNGNVYVSGSTVGDYGDSEIAVIKYGPDGELTWAKKYRDPKWAGSYAGVATVDESGNVYVVGTLRRTNGEEAIITLKYDPLGELVWAKQFTESNDRHHSYGISAGRGTVTSTVTAGCTGAEGKEYISILNYDFEAHQSIYWLFLQIFKPRVL